MIQRFIDVEELEFDYSYKLWPFHREALVSTIRMTIQFTNVYAITFISYMKGLIVRMFSQFLYIFAYSNTSSASKVIS